MKVVFGVMATGADITMDVVRGFWKAIRGVLEMKPCPELVRAILRNKVGPGGLPKVFRFIQESTEDGGGVVIKIGSSRYHITDEELRSVLAKNSYLKSKQVLFELLQGFADEED